MKKRGPSRTGLELLDVPSVEKEGMDPQFMAMQDFPHPRVQFDFQNERLPTFDFMNNTLGPHNQQSSEIEAMKQKITPSSSGHFPVLPDPEETKDRKGKHKRHKEKSKDKDKDKEKSKDKERERDKEKSKDKDKEKGKDKEKEKSKDKEKDKEKSKDKDKEKEKDKDKEKGKDKEKEKSKDKEKDKEKSKDKDKDKEKDKEKSKEKDKEKEKEKDTDKEKDKGKEKEKSKSKGKEKDKDREQEAEKDVETDREGGHKKKRKKRDSEGKKHRKKKDKDEKKEVEAEPEAEKEEDLTEVASVPLSPLATTPPIDEKVALDLSSIGKPHYERPKKASVHSRLIPPSEVKAEYSNPASPSRKPEAPQENLELAGTAIESSSITFDEREVSEDEGENQNVEALKELKERKRKHKHRHRHRRRRKEQDILLIPSPSAEPSVNSSPAKQVAPIETDPIEEKEENLKHIHSMRETVEIPVPQTDEKPEGDHDEEILKMPTTVQRESPQKEAAISSPPSSDSGKQAEATRMLKPPLPRPANDKTRAERIVAEAPAAPSSQTATMRRIMRPNLGPTAHDVRRTISLEVEQANQASKKASEHSGIPLPTVTPSHERTASLGSSAQLLRKGIPPMVRSISHERSLEEQLKELVENPKAGRLAGSKIKRELPPSVIGIHELRHAIGQSIRGQALPDREGIQGSLTGDSIDDFFTGANAAIVSSFKRTPIDDRNLQILKRNLTDKINVTEREFGGVNEDVRILSEEMGKVSACLASSQEKAEESERKAEKLEKGMLKMKKLVIAEADPGLHFDAFLRKILLRVFAYLIWFILFVSRIVLAPFMKPENLPPEMSVSEAARKIHRAAERIEMNRALEQPDIGSDDMKTDYC